MNVARKTLASGAGQDRALAGVPCHERHFYAQTPAIGRFGMRVFDPVPMKTAHWHGHVEANLLTGGSMRYDIDGTDVDIPEGRLVLFWAGIPHRLTELHPNGDVPMRLINLYLPIDAFLFMPHISALQVAILGGALVALPQSLCDANRFDGWYGDYRSGDVERREILKMELNIMLRRALVTGYDQLRPPLAEAKEGRTLSSVHIGHVVEMVRHILENLAEPLTNADISAVTGLHENYAMALFSRTMRLPMKRFVIRMRLLRARALLLESSAAITTVAEQAGFSSISQFYEHFGKSYGLSPHAMREKYARMELR